MTYDWPGNIRELESVLHRAVLLCEDCEIVLDEAPAARRGDIALHDTAPARVSPIAAAAPLAHARQRPLLPLDFQSAKAHAIADFERDYVSRLLEQTDGNISAAARLAKTKRRSFGKLVKKLGISCAVT